VNIPPSSAPAAGPASVRSLLESCLEWGVLLLSLLCGFLVLSAVPLLGKTLLPLRQGAPGDWLSCIFLVQAAALAGTWLADRLRSRSTLIQLALAGLWACLAIAACESMSLPGNPELSHSGVLTRIAFKFLPGVALLAGFPRLLRNWLLPSQERSAGLPALLFAVGGACSLITYPLWIEPVLPLGEQALFWEFLLVIVLFLCLSCALVSRKLVQESPRKATPQQSTQNGPLVPVLMAAALSSAVLFATTEVLAQELGSNAFTCGLPWCLQLTAFVCVAAGWLPRKAWRIALVLLTASLTGFLLTRGISSATLQGASLGWLLLLDFSAGLLSCSLLWEAGAQSTSPRLSLQACLPGLVGASAALFLLPALFAWSGDLFLYATALGILGLGELLSRRRPVFYAVSAILCAIPLALVLRSQSRPAADELASTALRNAHGLLIIHEGPAGSVLSTQSTTLATQITEQAEARRVATLYASQSSAAGLCITAYQHEDSPLRMGVIGLNGGTLAAYARPADRIHFWESNPAMVRASGEAFSYLRDCRGQYEVSGDNARQAIASGREVFDLLIVNGLPGDAPPSFLLTEEALLAYASRLSNRGLVIVHNSSRFHDAYPMLWNTAQKLGWHAIQVKTEVTEPGELSDYDPCASDYVILGRPASVGRIKEYIAAVPAEKRVTRTVTEKPTRRQSREKPWSDGINSSFPALQLEKLFQSQP